MIQKTKIQRWLPSLMAAVVLAGTASLCQAQSPIVISFDTGVPSEFYDASPTNAGGSLTNYWQSTNGPDGSGCEVYTIDGVIDQEIDPAFNVSFSSSDYATITFQLQVASGSGTIGTEGSGGYGNLQLAALDSNYGWNTALYETIYPPAANAWVTYTATVPTIQVAHLQIQLQGGSAYSGPVTVYIGNVTILPAPNPQVLETFTDDSFTWQNYNLGGTLDTTEDAPYYDPVTGAGPTSITPAGSLELSASAPLNGYPGGQLNLNFGPQRYEWAGVDVYYDGFTGPDTTNGFGGFQILIANSQSPYNWVWIGSVNFDASMIGKWIHYDFPCASSALTGAAGFAIQATPGSGEGTNNSITFHMDNFQLWNPETHPDIISFTPNTSPGGLKMVLDANGNSNPDDQEGICTPSATNADTDFFWINQTPATYSFTLTNFPAPAAPFGSTTNPPASTGAGYDAHIYLCNGDSITAFNNLFSYNQAYSGANYNMVDYLGLRVENAYVTNAVTYTTNGVDITTNNNYSLSGGVVAILEWKTNEPNANATNTIQFNFPTMASADGTWTLNFSDNTHGSIVAADGSVHNFTLPDFSAEPNFAPLTSFVQFGVYKNGNTNNNSLGNVFTQVLVTNTVTAISDNFSGPGLTANNDWQVAEYYQYAANRTTWIPAGTAYWITWNTTQLGFSVLSTTNLAGTWSDAGVTYTYTDGTGTNTVGAIPAASLPPGNADFFELQK